MVNMDNYQFAFDNSGNVIYYDRWATDYSEPTTDAVQNFIGKNVWKACTCTRTRTRTRTHEAPPLSLSLLICFKKR